MYLSKLYSYIPTYVVYMSVHTSHDPLGNTPGWNPILASFGSQPCGSQEDTDGSKYTRHALYVEYFIQSPNICLLCSSCAQKSMIRTTLIQTYSDVVPNKMVAQQQYCVITSSWIPPVQNQFSHKALEQTLLIMGLCSVPNKLSLSSIDSCSTSLKLHFCLPTPQEIDPWTLSSSEGVPNLHISAWHSTI